MMGLTSPKPWIIQGNLSLVEPMITKWVGIPQRLDSSFGLSGPNRISWLIH